MITRVIVCGTGAMACLFGGRLASVAEVALVGTWAEGIAAVRRQGILVEGISGNHVSRVQAERLGAVIEPADLILVLVKAWQTERVARYLPSLMKPSGVALTLQNGLGNLEVLGPRVHPGTTAEGATLIGAGHVREGGRGSTWVAAPGWVVDLLRCAGFEAQYCDPLEAEGLLWGKLVANCGINALTALLRIPNGDLLLRPETAGLMKLAAEECAAVAARKGIVLPFVDPEAQVVDVARRTAANYSSMLQDLLRGAPTECDAINGAIVKEGEELGVPTPVNRVLWQLVRAAASINQKPPD